MVGRLEFEVLSLFIQKQKIRMLSLFNGRGSEKKKDKPASVVTGS
jgi:hypothetical protein